MFARVAGLLTLAALIFAGCGRPETAEPTAKAARKDAIQVGFLLETYDVNRWARDEEYFVRQAEKMGATVIKAVADGDQDRQNKQADALLVRGADVLAVIPKNLTTAARIVTSAHQRQVPVVAYDRLIRDCDVDVYITFDNAQVGFLQAQGILAAVPEGNYILLGGAATDNNAKLLREGQRRAIAVHEQQTGKQITILADPFLDNWDREEARRRISNMLTRFKAEGKSVDAIVASNDSTAGGAIAALQAEGLAGKVAVSGQDAELTACQRVVAGTQTLTVYKPVRKLASVAAEVSVRLARGEQPEAIIEALGYPLNRLDNGHKEVPSIFLEPVYVTRDNMAATVIADGWHKREDVYADAPAE